MQRSEQDMNEESPYYMIDFHDDIDVFYEYLRNMGYHHRQDVPSYEIEDLILWALELPNHNIDPMDDATLYQLGIYKHFRTILMQLFAEHGIQIREITEAYWAARGMYTIGCLVVKTEQDYLEETYRDERTGERYNGNLYAR